MHPGKTSANIPKRCMALPFGAVSSVSVQTTSLLVHHIGLCMDLQIFEASRFLSEEHAKLRMSTDCHTSNDINWVSWKSAKVVLFKSSPSYYLYYGAVKAETRYFEGKQA